MEKESVSSYRESCGSAALLNFLRQKHSTMSVAINTISKNLLRSGTVHYVWRKKVLRRISKLPGGTPVATHASRTLLTVVYGLQ